MRLTGRDGELRIYDNNGQYYTVLFSNMDLKGPLGRASVDEILSLHRGRTDSNACYHKSSEYKIMEPIMVSFSCVMDDTEASKVMLALICDNPSSTNWTSIGESTKGTTMNDGTNYNPEFYSS